MTTFRSLLYLVAVATSLTCTVLLFRGYLRRRIRLLLWSAFCFAALTANNVLLYMDLVLFTDVDLRPWRLLFALTGILLMLYAFLWESD